MNTRRKENKRLILLQRFMDLPVILETGGSKSSGEKLINLEDAPFETIISKLLWTDRKIDCLKCGKEQYFRVDSYYEGDIKHYIFMCYECHDIVNIGLDRSDNSVTSINEFKA